MKNHSIEIISVLFCLIIANGCNKKLESAENPEKKRTQERPVAVRVVQVKKGPIFNYLELSSTIDARYYVDVFPRIEGEVLELLKDKGQIAKKGELLTTLEHNRLELEMRDAALYLEELHYQIQQQSFRMEEIRHQKQITEISVAELSERLIIDNTRVSKFARDLKRSKDLSRGDVISEETLQAQKLSYQEALSSKNSTLLALKKSRAEIQKYDMSFSQAELELRVLVNRIKKAEVSLEKTKINRDEANIYAPISGMITDRYIQVGQRVQPATKLFSIVDPSTLEISLGVPEKALQTLQKGQKAYIYSPFLPPTAGKIPEGKVDFISPVVNIETGTIQVTVLLDKNQKNVRPGMFVTVQIVTATAEKAILVPKKALLFDNNIPFLYVVRDGRAKKIILAQEMLGFSDTVHYQILKKIKKNDQVIIVGQSGLKDNALINVVSQPAVPEKQKGK